MPIGPRAGHDDYSADTLTQSHRDAHFPDYQRNNIVR